MGSVERCKHLRKRILEISQRVTCHIAPAFSCLELVDAIYHSPNFDGVLVLSKGHGCLALYAVLEDLGSLPRIALDKFCTREGRLGGHPDKGGYIQASTGSLGHGLGMAVGMAYAEKLKAPNIIGKGRVHVLISDGELQSGATWEAIMTASRLGLDNLTCIVDANGFGGLEPINIGERAWSKFREFGWSALRIDGHDYEDIQKALAISSDYPMAIIARTVKGKGISYMENAPIWHYRSPNAEEYAQALKELDA